MTQSKSIPIAHPGFGSRSLWAQIVYIARKPQFWFAVVGLVPTLIWYGIFSFGPILRAFPLAVQNYNLLDPSKSPFVGLDNFTTLPNLPMFYLSIRNTLYFSVLSFVMCIPIALILSVCLSSVRRGRNLYQALIFLPVVVSLIAVSLLFRMLMDPDVGQFNQILKMVGLPKIRWLSDSATAMPSMVGISTWKGMGFQVVLLTAGLLSIPEEIHDAAKVDGVNEWQKFWKITLPLLANTILLITVMLAIGSLQVYALPYTLSGSDAATRSRYVYNMLLYDEAFGALRFGRAAAASLMQFAFIMIVTLFQIKLVRPTWSY